jgi:hypothetical protein
VEVRSASCSSRNDLIVLRDIGPQRDGVGRAEIPQAGDRGVEIGLGSGQDGHLCAVHGEALRRRSAHALRASLDDRGRVAEPQIHLSSSEIGLAVPVWRVFLP